MIFHKTPLADAFIIEQQPHRDERGFLARYYCEREFAAAGLETAYPQMNDTLTIGRGTLRGLHYQAPPRAEAKVIRCVRGKIWDVIVDLRPSSPTFKKWFGTELNCENRLMMYAPRGFAHGMLTLSEEVELIYLMSDSYSPDHQRGLRWNDPAFAIEWPIPPILVSDKDAKLPLLEEMMEEIVRLDPQSGG